MFLGEKHATITIKAEFLLGKMSVCEFVRGIKGHWWVTLAPSRLRIRTVGVSAPCRAP